MFKCGQKLFLRTGVYGVVCIVKCGNGAVVYKVKGMDDENEYVMKAKENKPSVQIEMESKVLRACNNREHFCKLIDTNQQPYPLVIMTSTGPDLATFRKKTLDKKFSVSTAFRVFLQTLDALSKLHEIGFIHGNVKPSNLTIGPPTNRETIYLVNFGMCRQFRDKGVFVVPKYRGCFRGTIKYASLNIHKLFEPSCKDDLESLLYILIEFLSHSLPWNKCTCIEEVKNYKEVARSKYGKAHLYANCTERLDKIRRYLDMLNQRTQPNYKKIKAIILKVIEKEKYKMDEPLDWMKNDINIAQVEPIEEDTSTKSIDLQPLL